MSNEAVNIKKIILTDNIVIYPEDLQKLKDSISTIIGIQPENIEFESE